MIRFVNVGDTGLELSALWLDQRYIGFQVGFEWTGTEYEHYQEEILLDTGHPDTDMEDQIKRCVSAATDFARRHVLPELITESVERDIRDKARMCVRDRWKELEMA